MLGSEDTKLHSPITPLSFDFNKKKRSKEQVLKRCNSPDILNRSSCDLVVKAERMRASEENLVSPHYSECDYAPVSTERWVIRDSDSQGHLRDLLSPTHYPACYRGAGAPAPSETESDEQWQTRVPGSLRGGS